MLVAGVSLATAVILQRNAVTVNKGNDRMREGTVRYTGKGAGAGAGMVLGWSRDLLEPSDPAALLVLTDLHNEGSRSVGVRVATL